MYAINQGIISFCNNTVKLIIALENLQLKPILIHKQRCICLCNVVRVPHATEDLIALWRYQRESFYANLAGITYTSRCILVCFAVVRCDSTKLKYIKTVFTEHPGSVASKIKPIGLWRWFILPRLAWWLTHSTGLVEKLIKLPERSVVCYRL